MTSDHLSMLLISSSASEAVALGRLISAASSGAYQLEHAAHYDAALDQLRVARFDALLFSIGSWNARTLKQMAALRAYAPGLALVALTEGADTPPGRLSGAHATLDRRRLVAHTLLRAIHTAIDRASTATDSALLVEHLPLGVYLIDRAGRLQLFNPATGYLLKQLAGDELMGRPFVELIPGASHAHIANLLARAFAGERIEIEFTLPTRDRRRVFSSTLQPIRGADGTIHSLLGMTQDITEQIETRLEAEIERDRLSAAIQSSNDAIVMFDLDRRLILANRAWTALFGLGDGELLGLSDQKVLERIGPMLVRSELLFDAIQTLFANPHSEASGETVMHSPEYHVLPWYSVPVRTSAGTSLGRLFIFRDATRERQADQIKNEFISVVSHELRTPLTSIKGFTDLLLEGDAGPLTPEVRELLTIVQTSTDQLVAITNDILDTSRIESGQLTIDAKPLDAAAIIQHIVNSIRPQLAKKEQVLTADLPANLPLVTADRDRLAQILTNLLSNAHKYTPAQGQIHIQAELAEQLEDWHPPRAEGSGHWLVLRVKDNGIGIAREDQEQLFTRFYRVNNTHTQGIGGTGLGLSITRSLVELHGGRIWLESELGFGSTFCFSLPTVPYYREEQ